MKTTLYLKIIASIIWLFTIPIVVSGVTAHLHEFFGDIWVPYYETKYSVHYAGWEYSLSHTWFNAMCAVLFVASLIQSIILIRSAVIKEYPNLQ
jgi:hypothetical protein